MWGYTSLLQGILAGVFTLMSIGLIILLWDNDTFSLPGPVWMVSLFLFVPWISVTLVHSRSLIQIYVWTFLVLVISSVYIPLNLSKNILVGLGLGAASSVLVSGSLHFWFTREEPSSLAHSGLGWCFRFACAFMITLYASQFIYGNGGSFAVSFYRAPFILQPVAIFGLGSFEFVLVLTNAVLGWWVFSVFTTHKVLGGALDDLSQSPSALRKLGVFLTHPLVFLCLVWVIWIISAGIVTVAHVPDITVPVAMVGKSSSTANLVDLVALQIRRGAKFVSTPSRSIAYDECEPLVTRGPTCEEIIAKEFAPNLKGAYVGIGCLRLVKNDDACTDFDFGYILQPDGTIVSAEFSESDSKVGPKPYTANLPVELQFAYVLEGPKAMKSPLVRAAQTTDVNLLLVGSHDQGVHSSRAYTDLVITAIENRIAIVRAGQRGGTGAIIDPLGNIVAVSPTVTDWSDMYVTTNDVLLSSPLPGSWIRQQLPYWLSILGYVVFLILDVLFLRRSRTNRSD